jgi:TonB family protein
VSRVPLAAPTRKPDQHPEEFQVERLRRTLSTSADEGERKPRPGVMFAALIIAGAVLAGSIYWGAHMLSPSASNAPPRSTETQSSDHGVNLPQTAAQPIPRTPSSRRASAPKRSGTSKPATQSSATGLANSPLNTRATEDEAEEVLTKSLTPSQVSDPMQTAPPALAVTTPTSDGEPSVLASLPSTAPALSQDARVSRVSELKLVRRVAPKYPQSALLTRRQGTVMLRLTVGSNGRVKDAHVLSGDEDFAEAALNAVREWRYQPYRLDGKPVDVSTDAIITFSMTGTSNR